MAVIKAFPDQEDYTYRKLPVSLAPADWRTLADALAEEFPTARYSYEPMVLFRLFPVPPSIFQGDHMFRIADLDPAQLPEVEMHFDPDWQAEWSRPEPGIDVPRDADSPYWSSRPPRTPVFRFVFGRLREAADGHPPHIGDGYVWFFHAPGNREQLAVCHRIMRLFRTVAGNRGGQALLRGPRQREIRRYRTVSRYWLGNDAVRWAREDPARMLCYRQYADPDTSWGVRPLEG